ncbi:hypothetical protein M0804_010004 [Polistes exclamans]|nr:hypothetical protein M0804_010004 [Polistes exclamans]
MVIVVLYLYLTDSKKNATIKPGIIVNFLKYCFTYRVIVFCFTGRVNSPLFYRQSKRTVGNLPSDLGR